MASDDGRDSRGGSTTVDGGAASTPPTAEPVAPAPATDSPPVTPEDAALAGAATAVASRSEQMASAVPDGMSTAEREQIVGQVLEERYEITGQIGAGGMGAVYEARHTIIGKRVAIKVLLDKYAEKDQVIARLEQEARLASSIGHANIVDITDFGTTADGRRFVVMEYLDGQSLGELLKTESALPVSRIVHICRQIASALAAAHDKGIVHRDIKPENVFLIQREGRDFVKVVDFGISKAVRQDEAGDESPRLTQTGMVLGTPLYMSPEQARGDEDLDHRIDVYALGVIMYELATGDVPFRGTNYLNIISQVLSAEPRPLCETRPDLSIPAAFEAVTFKALAKDRSVRYQSMTELAADLTALAENGTVGALSGSFWAPRSSGARGSRRRTLGWIGGIGAVLATATAAVIATMGSDDSAANTVVPPVAADAAPILATVTADAAPAPAVDLIDVRLESTPPGANVWADDGRRFICQTPCPWKAVKQNKEMQLIFEIEGYDDARVSINPLTAPTPVRVRLDKAKRGKKRRALRKPPTAPDSTGGTRQNSFDDTMGGELMGNPVRRKKTKQQRAGGADTP